MSIVRDLVEKKNEKDNYVSYKNMIFYGVTGKAQPLYSKVFTKNGFKQMGEICVGDEVFGLNGLTKVQSVHPQGKRKIYRVYFNDGRYTDCADNHLWLVNTEKDRGNSCRKGFNQVLETKDMINNVNIYYGNRNRKNYKVPLSAVYFEKKQLKIPPYSLGALLGDGSFTSSSIMFTNVEDDVIMKVSNELLHLEVTTKIAERGAVRLNGGFKILKPALSEYGLLNLKSKDKFIPKDYLYTSFEDRLKLLRGLIDTDGTIDNKRGGVSYSTSSKRLKEDVAFLVRSLGGRCFISKKQGKYKKDGEIIETEMSYILSISFENLIPYSSEKHTKRYAERKVKKYKNREGLYITKIEFLKEDDCQCIVVEDESHTYITDDFIVTHNSSLIGGLSEIVEKPILVLSPAGGSEKIAEEFPNVISYPIASIQEANDIYKDLAKDFKTIRDLTQVILDNDVERLEKAKTHFGEEWEEAYKVAKNGELPISAIVLEEISTISTWIQNELEIEMDKTVLGENKNEQGMDWNKFAREIMDFYSKFLRLPITTILNTGEIQPKEKMKLRQVIPDICSGQASRKLIDMVGNCFYCNKTDDGKYYVQLTKDKDIFAKDKLLLVKTDKKLDKEIDVTNDPAKFWKYVDSLSESKIIKQKNKKGEC